VPVPHLSDLRDRVDREADDRGIDIDAIREVSTDDPGIRLRVIETDAAQETDQIGFEITYPDGPTADMMFSQQLEKSMRSLKDYIDGDDTDGSTDDVDSSDGIDSSSDDEPVDELEELANADQPEDPSTVEAEDASNTDRIDTPEPESTTIGVQVGLDDESIDDLVDDLEAVIEDHTTDVEEATDRVSELGDRIDDLDARVSDIESTFAAIGPDD